MRKVNKVLSKAEALAKAMHYCAYQERCHLEVRQKLSEMNVQKSYIGSIIAKLEKDRFLDEKRFAILYSESKFRLKHWGKNKIIYELEARKIPNAFIEKGINAIPDKEYLATLKILMKNKQSTLKESDDFILKNKIAAFVIGKGYEPDLVWKFIKKKFK